MSLSRQDFRRVARVTDGADSMVALSAKRLIWPAMFWIKLTMPPIAEVASVKRLAEAPTSVLPFSAREGGLEEIALQLHRRSACKASVAHLGLSCCAGIPVAITDVGFHRPERERRRSRSLSVKSNAITRMVRVRIHEALVTL